MLSINASSIPPAGFHASMKLALIARNLAVLGNIAFQLPSQVIYEFHNRLDDYGLSHLLGYLFGVSWVGLGYALHCNANLQQLAAGTPTC